MRATEVLKVALTYGGAALFGYIALLLRFPLPWMAGAMVFAILTSLYRIEVRIPSFTRASGQVVVASAIGISITPAAATAIGQQFYLMVLAGLLTIFAGMLAGRLLARLAGIDFHTASLCSIPGGPIEMALLARSQGAEPAPVAFAQTVRLIMIILIIPPLIVFLDGSVVDASEALASDSEAWQVLLLLGTGIVGGLCFRMLGVASPFFLGPLGLTALASAFGAPVGGLPYWMIACAQILLGTSMGRLFDREMLERSTRFLPAVVLSTLWLFALCAAIAGLICLVTGMEWQTAILATAPGNATEMALTAKVLQQGVAIVAAYHVVRLFTILFLLPGLFRLGKWFHQSSSKG